MKEDTKNPIIAAITYGFDFTYRILLEYSKFVLIIIILLISAEVFSRKVLGSSITWSEEVSLLLMVWMAFIAMAIGVEKKVHIAVVLFMNFFPKPIQKIVDFFNTVLITIFGSMIIYYGTKLIVSTWSSTMPATQLPAGALYLMIPVAGLYIMYFSLMHLLGIQKYHHRKFLDGGGD
ncbi:MAG: TRAP transporter small permease [Selenomonadaceae bacterium]